MLPEAPVIVTPTVITAVVQAVYGWIFSLLVEIVPGFSRWWDGVEDAKKRAIRGWIALLLSFASVAVMHYTEIMVVVLDKPATIVLGILNVLVGWGAFVLRAEDSYQQRAQNLPRKIIKQ